MRWNELPARTSISMSKGDVEKLRRSPTKTFFLGMATGACLLLVVQGTTTVEMDDPQNTPSPVSNATPSKQ